MYLRVLDFICREQGGGNCLNNEAQLSYCYFVFGKVHCNEQVLHSHSQRVTYGIKSRAVWAAWKRSPAFVWIKRANKFHASRVLLGITILALRHYKFSEAGAKEYSQKRMHCAMSIFVFCRAAAPRRAWSEPEHGPLEEESPRMQVKYKNYSGSGHYFSTES